MSATLDDVEFETRTIGPLVLTTPVLRQLGLIEIINRLCPTTEQADTLEGSQRDTVASSTPGEYPDLAPAVLYGS